MKLRYFIRGLGVGVIVTTIVLMISFHNSSKYELSDEEIMNRAVALGMEKKSDGIDLDELKDKSSNTEQTNTDNTNAESVNTNSTNADNVNTDNVNTDNTSTDQSKTNASNTDKSSTKDNINTDKSNTQDTTNTDNSSTTDKTTSTNVSKTSNKTDKTSNEDINQDSSSKKSSGVTTIKISSGMMANEITEYLCDIGVIESEANFNEYIDEHKSQSKICAGTYQIPEGATYSKILKIITKSKE